MTDFYCLEPWGTPELKDTPAKVLSSLHIRCYHVLKALERFGSDLDLLGLLDADLLAKIKKSHWSHLALVRAGFEALSDELEQMLTELKE